MLDGELLAKWADELDDNCQQKNFGHTNNYCVLGVALQSMPESPITRRQRFSDKIWDIRYRIASFFAGYDVRELDY